MIFLAILLALFSFPAAAAETGGHGVSSLPTPLPSVLKEYEDLISEMPEEALPANSDSTDAASLGMRRDAQGRLLPSRHTPIRPSVRITQGGGVVKRGTSHENGVTVYRGDPSAR